jgi:hypothetical protein
LLAPKGGHFAAWEQPPLISQEQRRRLLDSRQWTSSGRLPGGVFMPQSVDLSITASIGTSKRQVRFRLTVPP